MAKSKYKIGDTVTIIKRVGSSRNYHFSFVDEMAELAGKKFKIINVVSTDRGARTVPDDGFEYTLDGEARRWSWASSMFEDQNGNTDSISAFIKKKKCPELDFSL